MTCFVSDQPATRSCATLDRQARPRRPQRALFLTINALFRPLSGSSITAIVRMRLTTQGMKLDRPGVHCLRHACASLLADNGFNLKQIADHLSHRSMNTTRATQRSIYVG
jgi:integrase